MGKRWQCRKGPAELTDNVKSDDPIKKTADGNVYLDYEITHFRENATSHKLGRVEISYISFIIFNYIRKIFIVIIQYFICSFIARIIH